MPYIGRELDRGNYLKLDDISSSFDGSTTTFNLTNGGNAFYPGSAFSILVVLAGVVQEPEAAYQINQTQITFASAPLAGDQFFCIVLGQALGVNTPANGSVNGTQLAKPFNYDNYFYLDDANNRVGVGTATPMTPLHVEGTGRFTDLTVTGDLTVEGTTTTLDTVVTEVDKLEVGANNNTVGVAITQSGSGDAAYFMGGDVGIGTNNPQGKLHISDTDFPLIIDDNSSNIDKGIAFTSGGSSTYKAAIRLTPGGSDKGLRFMTGGYVNSVERLRIHAGGKFSFGTAIASAAKYTFNSAGTNEVARFTSTDTGAYLAIKDSNSTSINFVEGGGDVLSLGVNSVERLRITTSGVGIGTNNPQSQFEVFGTSPIVRSKHSTSQKYTQINHDGTGGYLDWSSGDLVLRGASNSQKVRITDGGDVRIQWNNNNFLGSYYDADYYMGFSFGASSRELYIDNRANDTRADIVFRTVLGQSTPVERVRITSAGRIGINASNNTSYDINADDVLIASDGNTGVTIRSVGSTPFGMIHFADGTSNNSEKRAGRIVYQHDGDNMMFNTADTERIRISGAGQIGMGKAGTVTVNGNSPLTIQESDSNSETICLRATNSGGNGSQPGIVMKTAGGGHIGGIYCDVNSDYMRISTSGTDRVYITNDGKVGVGVASPLNTFHVYGANTIARFQSSTSYIDLMFQNTGATNGFIQYNNSGNFNFYANSGSTPTLTITAGAPGNVIVGSTTNYAHVNADNLIVGDISDNDQGITIGSANQGQIAFADSADSRAGLIHYQHTDNSMRFMTNGATNERLRITSAGSIGIGVASPVTDVDISQKTGAVALPQGTTAQRPSGSAPYIRKNTTNNALEFYNGTEWVEIITDYFPTGSTILG